jgi:hypothetical protein
MQRFELKWLVPLASLVVALTLIVGSPVQAGPEESVEQVMSEGVVTPEEQDLLEFILDEILPPLPTVISVQPPDIGEHEDSASENIPGLDVFPPLATGDCDPWASAPGLGKDQVTIRGSAGLNCPGTPPPLEKEAFVNMQVCLQVRTAQQWKTIDDSCRSRSGVLVSSLSKKTFTVCRPGTWRYRTWMIASTVPEFGAYSEKSAPSGIRCHPGTL